MAKDVKITIAGDTTKAEASIGELKSTAKRTFQEMSKDADKSGRETSAAFKRMGIRTTKDIEDSSRRARDAYLRIKNSGTASANDIKRAHNAMTAKIKSNNREMQTGAGRLSKAFAAVKGPLLALVAIGTGIKLFKDMTAAALENEIQVNKLKTQVKNLGINYDEQAESINRAVQATSKYAIVQSGDVSQVLQDLLFVTGDLTKSQEALNTVYDLAHLKGLDVKTATELVGRALSGNVEALGRYFVEFKGLNETLGANATLQDKAAFAMAFLNERVTGSIANMTKHELAVRRVKNTWASFVQFSGEVIIGALDKLFNGLQIIRISFLQTTKGVIFVAKQFAFLSDKIFGTNKATAFLDNITNQLNEDIRKINRSLTEEGRKAALLEKTNRKLGKSYGDLAKEIKKRSDNIEDEIKLIDKAKDTDIEALNQRDKLQKTVNDKTKERLDETKKLLNDLKNEIASMDSFIKQIESSIQAAEKSRSQQGLNTVQVLLANLEEAQGKIKEANEAFKQGRIDDAKELSKEVVNAANAVISANKKELQEAGISVQGLDEAVETARSMNTEILEIANKFKELKESEIPGVTQKVETLETAFSAGKQTVEGIKEAIDEAKTKAQALKDKLKENTEATHTQIIETVRESAVGLKTGGKLPGYGGGDRVPALLEAGEYVLRKEAVKRMGIQTIDAINRMDLSRLIKFDAGKIRKFKEGGSVSKDNVNVNLMLGNKNFGMSASRDIAADFVNNIRQLNIKHGRYRNPY